MNCGKTVVKIKPTDNTAERVRVYPILGNQMK